MNGGLHILQMATVRWYNACADYAVRISLGLSERGHRVVVGGYPGSPVLQRAKDAGLPVLDAFDFRPGRLSALGAVVQFRRYIAASQFDLVNAHRAEDHVMCALALAQGRKVPLVRTRGDVRPPRRSLPNRFLYERYTAAHILAARFMRQRFYQEFQVAPDRLVTIPPGFHVDSFRAGAPERLRARDQLGLPRHGRVVGLVGRLTAVKGHLVALEAFAQVLKKHPDTRFVIAGAAYDISPAMLRERAHSLGIGASLVFLPQVPDVRTILKALDLGVIASTGSEAICRVALEYGALGIPVIGTDVNSIPEIVVHGKTGLIVPPGDAAALAQALSRLFADPPLMERMGDEGPPHVRENYSLDRMIETTETLYRLLLRAARS